MGWARPADNLVIQFREADSEPDSRTQTEIQLDSVQEHTGSFTQFQYSSREAIVNQKLKEKKEAKARNKDNFDEIWSSL